MIQNRSIPERPIRSRIPNKPYMFIASGRELPVVMNIGYARVSRKHQNLALQLAPLKKAGCKKIFQEKRSARKFDRIELNKAIATLKRGDTLVFWSFDRLGRTAREMINLNYDLKCRGIFLKSLTQNIDTTTPRGERDFIIECAEAQYESEKISLRTTAGLVVARNNGSVFGRPPRMSPRQVERARFLRDEKDLPFAGISDRMKIPQATIWRALSQTASN